MRSRKGFTLIEIMFALVLLMVVILGMTGWVGRFMRQVTVSELEVAAVQLADDRIQTILMDPDYGGLDSTYAQTETTFPSLTGFQRVTTITRIGGVGQTTDHKRIVVVVTGPGLASSVKRSATVAAP